MAIETVENDSGKKLISVDSNARRKTWTTKNVRNPNLAIANWKMTCVCQKKTIKIKLQIASAGKYNQQIIRCGEIRMKIEIIPQLEKQFE